MPYRHLFPLKSGEEELGACLAMSKRKKSKAVQSERKGYDYGIRARLLAMSSMEFVQNLSRAEIVGVAYGTSYSSALDSAVPIVSLIGRNADPLRRAFEEFHTWSSKTDGDAVDVTFLFLNSGGYLVGVTPEPQRLLQRTAGFERTYDSVFASPIWVKQLDTISQLTLRFKQYKQRLVSPFILGGAVLDVPSSILSSKSVPPLRPISSDILKLEATFVDEDKIQERTIPATLLGLAQGKASAFKGKKLKGKKSSSKHEGLPNSRTPTAEHVRLDRASTLRRHFPVTLQRINDSKEMQHLKKEILREEVSEWQFVQAMCNLILSSDMKSSPHFADLPQAKYGQVIAETLSRRFEVADDKARLADYPAEQVREQIRLDATFLLHEFGDRVSSTDIATLTERLKRMDLLDGK